MRVLFMIPIKFSLITFDVCIGSIMNMLSSSYLTVHYCVQSLPSSLYYSGWTSGFGKDIREPLRIWLPAFSMIDIPSFLIRIGHMLVGIE